jgi:ethanolamine utilization protein EutN
MRLGHVIGRVTLSQQDPAYKGGRFLLVQPFSREQFAGAPLLPLAKGSSLVVYDNLGAGVGHVIAFTEGAEASAPFDQPTPVDAFNAALVDKIFYTPPV